VAPEWLAGSRGGPRSTPFSSLAGSAHHECVAIGRGFVDPGVRAERGRSLALAGSARLIGPAFGPAEPSLRCRPAAE
jgi:hypothetical protein